MEVIYSQKNIPIRGKNGRIEVSVRCFWSPAFHWLILDATLAGSGAPTSPPPPRLLQASDLHQAIRIAVEFAQELERQVQTILDTEISTHE